MYVSLTRADIKQHAAALQRIEALENWHGGINSHARYIRMCQHNSQFSTTADCGFSSTERTDMDEEAIFRKHMDAAIEEALAYWKKRANLTG